MEDIKYEKYSCPKLRRDVNIEITYATIENIAREMTKFNCNHVSIECGVIEQTKQQKSYNWDVCPAQNIFT